MGVEVRGSSPPLWREVVIGLATFGVYIVVELVGGLGGRQAADQHGRAVGRLEHSLGIDVEAQLNRWLAPHKTLTVLANYEYAFGYLAAAAVLIIWCYLRRPLAYPLVRTSFIILNLIGIACFLLYPLTPPRKLPELGLVDTVREGHTWGSWGSSWIEHANQQAAMPSMHLAWALWVSVMLPRLIRSRWPQALSAVNVGVTTWVILATANHFLLDGVAAVVAVFAAVLLAGQWERRRVGSAGTVVPSADAFFWYLEADAPQQAGGIGLFAPSPRAAPLGKAAPSLEQVRARVAASLAASPEFRQRLVPGSGWRRPRWVAVDRLDLDQHVTEHDLTTSSGEPGGVAALNEYVSQLAAEPLPVDRPMWRVVLVRGVAADQSALVLLVHHTIADGLGVIDSAVRLFEARETERPAPTARGHRAGIDATARRYAGALRRGAGTLVGLAQLATDGSPRAPLTRVSSPQRDFASACFDLDTMVAVAARHGCHVTDVLLCAVAAGFSNGRPDLSAAVRSRLRVAVPLPILGPRSGARSGNVTSGVMIDLPLDPMPLAQRLAVIAQRSRRLRTPTRALASRAVLARGLSLVPPRAARWFARTVYGHRFFHGIVSNMEGPDQQLWLGEAKLTSVVPILPLAAGAPLAVGALGWNGTLGIGVATDPTVLSATQLCAHVEGAMRELADLEPQADRAARLGAPS